MPRTDNKITDEEKSFIDSNYKTSTIIEIGKRFKRTSLKVYYRYYESMGYQPFRRWDTYQTRRAVKLQGDGFFHEGTGDWLTGSY